MKKVKYIDSGFETEYNDAVAKILIKKGIVKEIKKTTTKKKEK